MSQFFHPLLCPLCGFFVRCRDVYMTIFFNVHLYTGLADDFIDYLSSASDNIANSIHRNRQCNNLRRIRRQMFSRFIDAFGHLSKNKHTALLCLLKSRKQNFTGKPMDFDIHLDRCDPFRRSCHFEIHITKRIFHSLYIGKNSEMFTFIN